MYYLNQLSLVCPLGATPDAVAARLFAGDSGLVCRDSYSPGRPLPIGAVDDALPALDGWPRPLQSRNNRLTLAAALPLAPAVEAVIARHGSERVAVVIGTSTSGIAEGEAAMQHHARHGTLPERFHYGQQELMSPAAFLARHFGARGPALAHSAACASSAKAMAAAARLLKLGVADAVITGGVDSLCAFTIAGFCALDSVSSQRCTPLSARRAGINIGEAAALFVMSREPARVALTGWGESSDGYHMSAPDPSGNGARIAIEQALARAGLSAADIDYINLHGTATRHNDAMESTVLHALFGDRVAVSSTKPLVGHTLGAAGAIEAAFCWLAMQTDDGRLPPHLWDGEADAELPRLNIAGIGARLGRPIRHALSNSFAFGGANAALVFSRSDA
ncbi:beta-ketoacyl-ACP synthase [Chitinivorax sp. PXF-14]|uniref:beta-ketoacyl-ACP synthase n=1 Tax=Chitinivorax sp. PXF-14 TaxID=3230488 RepID=UPI0034666BA1